MTSFLPGPLVRGSIVHGRLSSPTVKQNAMCLFQILLGNLILTNLTSLVGSLLPHEYEELLGRLLALASRSFIVGVDTSSGTQVSLSLPISSFGLVTQITVCLYWLPQQGPTRCYVENTTLRISLTCCRDTTSSTPLLSPFQPPVPFAPPKVLSSKYPRTIHNTNHP